MAFRSTGKSFRLARSHARTHARKINARNRFATQLEFRKQVRVGCHALFHRSPCFFIFRVLRSLALIFKRKLYINLFVRPSSLFCSFFFCLLCSLFFSACACAFCLCLCSRFLSSLFFSARACACALFGLFCSFLFFSARLPFGFLRSKKTGRLREIAWLCGRIRVHCTSSDGAFTATCSCINFRYIDQIDHLIASI